MVLRELNERAVLCIGQPGHAWLSAQIARAWGNGLFPGPWPREEVLLAVEQHDIGMAAWDAEPTLNPETGLPHSFLELPLETHLAMWTRAPGLALTQSRWAGLLVSMHGTHLYGGRAGEPGVAEFLDAQTDLQRSLISSLGISEAQARQAQRLLAAWDWASLAMCMKRLPTTLQSEPPVRVGIGRREAEVTFAPWPFATDSVRIAVEGRVIEERFDDQDAMRAALARAPWRTLGFTLTPG
jgi:hypothetical protein